MPLIRPIILSVDERLTTAAAPCGGVTLDVLEHAQDLVDTLRALGLPGLSAPQIGLPFRIIVVDPPTEDGGDPKGPLVIVDPVIVARDGAIDEIETCPSLPGIMVEVHRANRIFVRGFSLEGRAIGAESWGIEARHLQHEIDHLDGLLIG